MFVPEKYLGFLDKLELDIWDLSINLFQTIIS